MDEKKLVELMKSEDFVEKMLEAATQEEVKELFKTQGMELSDGDIEILAKAVAQIAQIKEPLSENDLNTIAGGFDNTSIAAGAGIGVGASAVIVGAIYGGYKLYRKGVEHGKKEVLQWCEKLNPNTQTVIKKQG